MPSDPLHDTTRPEAQDTRSLAPVVEAITAALHDRDLPTARDHFNRAVQGDQADLGSLLKQLAGTVEIPKGTVTLGFGIDVWSNPYRGGYAWRCGDCRWTGSNYTTDRSAHRAAKKHAAEHQEPRPVVVEIGTPGPETYSKEISRAE
uniref:hypothetical protein n=1 Tax=Streptosporangium sp. CA-235898 TaxID=3240073 RepID=UPI003F493065